MEVEANNGSDTLVAGLDAGGIACAGENNGSLKNWANQNKMEWDIVIGGLWRPYQDGSVEMN